MSQIVRRSLTMSGVVGHKILVGVMDGLSLLKREDIDSFNSNFHAICDYGDRSWERRWGRLQLWEDSSLQNCRHEAFMMLRRQPGVDIAVFMNSTF